MDRSRAFLRTSTAPFVTVLGYGHHTRDIIMDQQLLERVRRLHVAIGRTADSDLTKFPAKVYSGPRGHGVMQDFSGGRSEAEMSESLHGLIHNIASFHDHLKKWGDGNGVSGDTIHNFLKASFEFCVGAGVGAGAGGWGQLLGLGSTLDSRHIGDVRYGVPTNESLSRVSRMCHESRVDPVHPYTVHWPCPAT